VTGEKKDPEFESTDRFDAIFGNHYREVDSRQKENEYKGKEAETEREWRRREQKEEEEERGKYVTRREKAVFRGISVHEGKGITRAEEKEWSRRGETTTRWWREKRRKRERGERGP